MGGGVLPVRPIAIRYLGATWAGMIPFFPLRRISAGLLFGLGASTFLTLAPAGAADRTSSRPMLAALDSDATPAAPDGRDVPWSAVVRDIQRELRDLGLYIGPIDGRYSAEVKDAIDRFERLHGRIGEGTPLADTLRSIVSVRDALRLRRNLDEVRQRQTEEALQALRASPNTRDLVERRRPGGSRNGTDRADCGAGVSVDCLLAEARRAAAGTDEQNFHDWAMREIILTEVRTGRGGAAVRDRLRQISDPRLVLVAMREVAEAMAQDGRVADAIDLAETIPDAENQVRALSTIAVSAAKLGDEATAKRLSRRVVTRLQAEEGLAARVAIATALASGLAQSGDIEGARAVIRAARGFASPATAGLIRRAEVGMVTGASAQSGDYDPAVDALSELAAESASAMIAASASAVSRAAQAEQDRYRVPTLCNLAVVQAKAGNSVAAAETVAKAAETADHVRKGYPQDYAWFSVALAWARIGRFDEAGTALDQLGNELLQAEGLWRAAEMAALTGDTDVADRFERRAHAAATRIDSRFDRAMLLGDMAVAAASVRRTAAARRMFDEALNAGQAIEAGWWRARAFARLATALHVVTDAEAVH
jgi:peptidoglycan hydrolase-like protein with peptidoglycan-binding domain